MLLNQMHIGHIRSTVIGNALDKLYRFHDIMLFLITIWEIGGLSLIDDYRI